MEAPSNNRMMRDEFLQRLKGEWRRLWMERFDDRVRAEGVAVQDYRLLFIDRGSIIFATRDARTPSFSEIIEFWVSKGYVYAPNPAVGGWGKFIRTQLSRITHSRAKILREGKPMRKCGGQQLKKGGRGWLHIK